MRLETFSIQLLPEIGRSPDGERMGEIRIGSFVERFAVNPLAGDVNTLVAVWHDALRSLLAGADVVGLPTASNMTWVMYRFSDVVLVQQMLMLADAGPQLLPDGKVVQIPAHQNTSEDGQPISKWYTTVEAVSAFVAA